MTEKKRLGRGLEALLGGLPGWGAAPPPAQMPASPPPPLAAVAPPPPLHAAAEPHAAPEPHVAMAEGPPRTASPLPAALPESMPSPRFDAPAHTDYSPSPEPFRPVTSENSDVEQTGSKLVALELIDSNPHQPRQDFDQAEIDSLAESLNAHGLLQPVVVRRVEDHYQLIAGERRLRAAKQAGWTDVPVNIIEADERETAELAIIENLQRKDLNALEKAASFQRYLEQYRCTQEELAVRLKLDRSTIANLIRLLELPEAVQESLRQGRITQGHARAMLPLGEEQEQISFCERIQKEGLNVRQTEAIVQEMIAAADREPFSVIGRDGSRTSTGRSKSEHLAAMEQEFRAALGLRVKITHDARGRGKVVIQFGSHEEFERLRQHIRDAVQAPAQSHAG